MTDGTIRGGIFGEEEEKEEEETVLNLLKNEAGFIKNRDVWIHGLDWKPAIHQEAI